MMRLTHIARTHEGMARDLKLRKRGGLADIDGETLQREFGRAAGQRGRYRTASPLQATGAEWHDGDRYDELVGDRTLWVGLPLTHPPSGGGALSCTTSVV